MVRVKNIIGLSSTFLLILDLSQKVGRTLYGQYSKKMD